MNKENSKLTLEIRQECIDLFSSKNIFNNCETSLFERYRNLYKKAPVIKLFKDTELVATAHAFFDYNLNISTTSKKSFMHRNTLIYRLDKIKKMVGLDIRNFKEAVVFENLLLFYDMINL